MATVTQRLPDVGLQVVVVSFMAALTVFMRDAVNLYPEARAGLLKGVVGMRDDLLSGVPLCPDCGHPMTPNHGSTH